MGATMLSSAGGLLAMLNEPHASLKFHALSNLNANADLFWHEISTFVPIITKLSQIISGQVPTKNDSDLPLTPVLRPCNRHVREKITITSTQNTYGIVQVVEVEENPVRIIPGPAGIVQLTKIRKQSDIHEGGDDSVLSTQEYKSKGGIVSGCLGDIKTFLKNGKLEQVVAIIKSCSPNALGDLKVTVKDLSGTLAGSIHYKVINEKGYGKEINVGSAIILANVFVFSPNPLMHYFNITKKNVVKVFHKDFVPCNGQNDLYKFDEEALDLVLEEEARESRAHEEWLEKCRQQEEEDAEDERQLLDFHGTI
ncbi:ribonuclease H-like domain-containing protein [Tanacetum coccineum]